MTERSANKHRVLEIYGYKCANFEVCGNDDVTCHHIVFKREGGGDTKGNLAALCHDCHRELHHRVDEMEGFTAGLSKKERRKRKTIFRRKKR